MTRKRGYDLTGLLADSDLRSRIATSIGEEAFAQVTRLVGQDLRGYASATESPPSDDEPVITEGLVELAVQAGFTADHRDLFGPSAGWVLDNSVIGVSGGRRRLTLRPAARAAILDSKLARDMLPPLLESRRDADLALASGTSDDLESLTGAYLRMLLRGDRLGDLAAMRAIARQALIAARRALGDVRDLPPDTPGIPDCERQLALAELLDPLGIMIGLADTREGRGPDRFVGRDEALTALRALVDVLEAESLGETFSRTTKRAGRMLWGLVGTNRPRMLLVTASGGMGKSTLIAKFVLDHALDPERRLPFAILDFDRAALQPRNPASLLAEIARQIALQFPDAASNLSALELEIETAHAEARVVDLERFCAKLMAIVSGIQRQYEANSFLVTLDTLELVESDPSAMEGVCDLLRTLAGAEFPQLCVVASGRSGNDDLKDRLAGLYEIEAFALKPFQPNEARLMVNRLGERLMSDGWQPRWAAMLAGGASDPPIRREPLTLRLAVEIVRDTAPDKREALVSDIQKKGATATSAFVGALYQMRVLDHVRGDGARALAWPGLVARTVSRDMARTVLAPLCGLDPAQAEEGFDQLARQGWIVESEGEVLRHRRDLRARTLPLMRQHDPERFDAVLRRLIGYYGTGPAADPVELAYYRLLSGDDVLREDWPLDVLRDLSDMRADFPRDSDSRLLVEAVSRRYPLPADSLRRLPSPLLWAHVAAAGQSLRGLDDKRIEDRVAFLAESGPPDADGPGAPDIRRAWQYVQIKTGQWARLDPEDLSLPACDEDAALFGFFAGRMALAGAVPPDLWARTYPGLIARITSQRASKSWRALAEALVTARCYDEKLAQRIDRDLAANPPKGSRWGRAAETGLRVLMLFGAESRRAAFGTWCAFEAMRVREGICVAELALIAPVLLEHGLTDPGTRLRRALEDASADARAAKPSQHEPAIVQDTETLQDLPAAFEGLARIGLGGKDWDTIRDYCRLREPDWVVPMGYLLNAHLPGDWADALPSLVPWWPQRRFWKSRLSAQDRDVIAVLDRADRMGRFGELVGILGKRAGIGDAPIFGIRDRARRAGIAKE